MGATENPSALTTRKILFGFLLVFFFYILLHLSSPETIRVLREKTSFWNDKADLSIDNGIPLLPPPLQHGVDARLEWDTQPVPESKLLRHAPGVFIVMKLQFTIPDDA